MNNKFLKLGRLAIAVLAVAMLFLIGGCARAPTAPLPPPEKIELGELQELERNIVIEAEGGTYITLRRKNGLRVNSQG